MSNTFKQTKKEDFSIKPLNKVKRSHRKLKVTSIALFSITAMTFGFLFTALAVEYKDTHSFKYQSPIVLQRPVIIKRNLTIISPLSTQSGMMKAYAEEIKNPFDVRSPKGIAFELVRAKWGVQEWAAFDQLITKESGWHNWSVNSESGASGLGQSLGHDDYTCELWDYECQLKWTIAYIGGDETKKGRYGTPTQAWEFHLENNWY